MKKKNIEKVFRKLEKTLKELEKIIPDDTDPIEFEKSDFDADLFINFINSFNPQIFYFIDVQKIDAIEKTIQRKALPKPVIYLDENRKKFLKECAKKFQKRDPIIFSSNETIWLFSKINKLQKWIDEKKSRHQISYRTAPSASLWMMSSLL